MRTCRICRTRYEPTRPMQVVCSPSCAILHARKAMEKSSARNRAYDRRETRAKLEKLKTRSDYIKEAQTAFNSYIRQRDADQPCISCGTTGGTESLTGGYWDCGHYRSTGAAPHLRYTETNAAKQCKRCNRQLAGNAVAYRSWLIARIGLQEVETLEADQTIRKWSIDDLKAITATYKAKLKDLRNARSA